MSREQQKRGKQEKSCDGAEKVIVVVKASKEIPKTALLWSLTHVVQPGDCITLLIVVPSQSSGKILWGFPRFAGDCASAMKKYPPGTFLEQKSDITDSCSQMILQLHDVYDPNKKISQKNAENRAKQKFFKNFFKNFMCSFLN